jgi:hypothetical protein
MNARWSGLWKRLFFWIYYCAWQLEYEKNEIRAINDLVDKIMWINKWTKLIFVLVKAYNYWGVIVLKVVIFMEDIGDVLLLMNEYNYHKLNKIKLWMITVLKI